MITDNLLSTNDGGASWYPAPVTVVFEGFRYPTSDLVNAGRWADLAASAPTTYREWQEQGAAWLGRDLPVIQSNPEPEDDDPVAAAYLSGTQQERDDAHRQALLGRIETNRQIVTYTSVDLRRDPGLNGLMDEANAAADERTKALNATPDADLDAFDPTLQPQAVGSLALASSLARQETELLNSGVSLTPAQKDELGIYIEAHQAIVAVGDDTVEVHGVPSFARRAIGIIAEDYGVVIATRVFHGTDWWLEFELRTERILDPGDYWMAVYDETAPDDRSDTTTGYLTTPQLTEVSPGVYRADRAAVNLPRPDTSQVFKFTLCHQHINNPQFDKMTLLSGDEFERYRARWAGSAEDGGPWVNTGQTVDSIPYGNGLRIQDTTGFAPGDQIKMLDLEYIVSSVFNATDLILTVHPDNSVIGEVVYKR